MKVCCVLTPFFLFFRLFLYLFRGFKYMYCFRLHGRWIMRMWLRKWLDLLLLLQSALQPLVGFRPAQLSLSILSRKVLLSAVASCTSNPQLEENQGFRAFQLSPQEAPSVWNDASELRSGRWNYGREMAKKFCRMWGLPRQFWVLIHAVKHGMGQTALLPLRRKACWGFFSPKNSTGFEPANLGT
jgi:hypothetical protein